MKSFISDRGTGYSDGAMLDIIARIQDIKASSETTKKRLVVQERGKRIGQRVIDIDMKHAKDLEEKETYVFKVNEKADTHNGFSRRKMSTDFTAYDCAAKPEAFVIADERKSAMTRFGNGKRTKF